MLCSFPQVRISRACRWATDPPPDAGGAATRRRCACVFLSGALMATRIGIFEVAEGML
jgi:hypothetical protein